MKKYLTITLVITLGVFTTLSFFAFKPAPAGVKYLQVTTIESVVPGGLGRSRMITIDGAGAMQEIKMKNFFSMGGINFKNVRANDALITDKIGDLTGNGWKLVMATPGVYAGDKTGIFITRYLFSK